VAALGGVPAHLEQRDGEKDREEDDVFTAADQAVAERGADQGENSEWFKWCSFGVSLSRPDQRCKWAGVPRP